MKMTVLKPEDEESILELENNRLAESDLDPVDAELLSWHARWRKESLQYYLPLGWSFGVWSDDEKDQLLGYLLAQPFLFFRGLTQTLWVEHLSWTSEQVLDVLIEVAYKWSRDKHLQKVIFSSNDEIKDRLQPYSPQAIQDDLLELKTSKLR